MNGEEELLAKRFIELSGKAERGGYFTFTEFLGLAEQSVFSAVKQKLRCPFSLFGGADGCERLMVRFGDASELGYEEPFPIKVIMISPKSEKFAETLSHRDYLGAILNLGIERRELGDIAINGKTAYLFATEKIADYIISSLERIRRTDVCAKAVESLPDIELFRTERIKVQAVGERVDAIIAKIFHLSREEASKLFAKGLVFISGKQTENTSAILKVGDTVSVRGYGRFIYRGYSGLSKKESSIST